MADSDIQQIPGVYHRRIGDIVVTAIADGFLDGDIDVLLNITQEESRDILSANFRPARRTAVNTFLVRSSGEVALMETGCGTYMQPMAGKQKHGEQALEAQRVAQARAAVRRFRFFDLGS